MFGKCCRSHAGSASSFSRNASKSFSDKKMHACKALYFPITWERAVSLLPGSKCKLQQRWSTSLNFMAAVQNFHEEPLNLSVGTWYYKQHKWSRTHGGPASSFFLECNWIWVEVTLMICDLQIKDHIRGRLCTFPQGACGQFVFRLRLIPNADRCAELHTQMVSVMHACVWITTLPCRGQNSQSFCVNPWST